MRVFAERYPDDTPGVVLVDATSPDTTLSLNGKLVRIMREMANARLVPDVQTMTSSPPKLVSNADFRKPSGE